MCMFNGMMEGPGSSSENFAANYKAKYGRPYVGNGRSDLFLSVGGLIRDKMKQKAMANPAAPAAAAPSSTQTMGSAPAGTTSSNPGSII